MASTSTTVRIGHDAHATLRALASDTGQSSRQVLEHALRTYRDQVLLDRTNAAYAALRADPDAWREELAEREEWDATLADGLEPTPSVER